MPTKVIKAHPAQFETVFQCGDILGAMGPVHSTQEGGGSYSRRVYAKGPQGWMLMSLTASLRGKVLTVAKAFLRRDLSDLGDAGDDDTEIVEVPGKLTHMRRSYANIWT